MDGGAELVAADDYDELIFHRLLDEVYLLMDYISGRAEKSLSDFNHKVIRIPDGTGKMRLADDVNDVISHICALRYPPEGGIVVSSQSAAFLLMVKDELGRLADPAIGLTVAYTTMVVGAINEVSAGARAKTSKPSTRRALAARAYPGLVDSARWLRFWISAGLALMLMLTVATVYISGLTSLGHGLLQTIDSATKEFAAANAAVRAIEHTDVQRNSSADRGAEPFYRLCDRPNVRQAGETRVPTVEVTAADGTMKQQQIQSFDSGVQHEACDQWSDANRKRDVAYDSLKSYVDRFFWFFEWPAALASRVRDDLVCWSASEQPNPKECWKGVYDARATAIAAHYTPEWVANVLVGLSTYLLPMSFTVLGAAVSIIRDMQDRIRRSLLGPRDLPLAWGRFALGMIAGAAIGLFYTPTDPSAVAGGAGTGVALSASGLAFLAGYGVDSVFAAFDRMLRRFTDPASTPNPVSPLASIPQPLSPAPQPGGG